MALLATYGHEPPPGALDAAKELLVAIERWKAMCLKSRVGYADANPQRIIWEVFQDARTATSDYRALRSIMDLVGFGSTEDPGTGQRRAKTATSVLRFLKPQDWGVVDWRTAAMLAQLDRTDGGIDLAVSRASKIAAQALRKRFDIIDPGFAIQTVQTYRKMRSAPLLPRAADIDMALFGLSLRAWPM
jgi:hypothetical protein